MKFRSAFAVLSMTVALAACGDLPFQKSDEPEAQGHSGPPSVSPLEQPIETGSEGKPVATAEASTLNTAMFRAAGAGWTVTADDKIAVYERPGARSVGVTVRRMVYGRGVEFIGSMNGTVFALNIQAAECRAGDQKTPFTARLRVGSQRLSGCAAPTDSMPKPQVRASSAAPKPKAQPKPAAPAAKPAATEAETPATAPAATPETGPATDTPATTTPATPAPATTAPETMPPAPTTSPAAPAETPATETPATETPATGAGASETPAASPSTPPAAEAPAASGGGSDAASGVPAPALILPEPPAPSE